MFFWISSSELGKSRAGKGIAVEVIDPSYELNQLERPEIMEVDNAGDLL